MSVFLSSLACRNTHTHTHTHVRFRFLTYGDLPVEEHLEMIENDVLSKFDRLTINHGRCG